MAKTLRLPSPAMVVAAIALFIALSGTAVAAGIVPRAKFALNAGKLQGKTAAQVAAMPSPPTSGVALLATRSAAFSLGANDERSFTVPCSAGEKAVSGGFTTSNVVLAADTAPTPDGASWQIYLINLSSSQPASGNVYAVCIR